MSRHRAITFVVTTFCSACYALQPAGVAAPRPGGEVALRLSDRGRTAVARTLGSDVSLVHGSLLRRDGDEYVVAMSSVEFSSGGSRLLSGDSTRIATTDVAELFVSRLSKPRTIVAATVAAVALGVMAHEALKQTETPNPPSDNPPGSGDKQRSGGSVSLFVTPSGLRAFARSSIVRLLLQTKR